jgi:hypothetical protein
MLSVKGQYNPLHSYLNHLFHLLSNCFCYTSRIMLNKTDKSDHSFLLHILEGKLSFFSFFIMLAMHCHTWILLFELLSPIDNLQRVTGWYIGFYQMLLLGLLEWSLFLVFNLINVIYHISNLCVLNNLEKVHVEKRTIIFFIKWYWKIGYLQVKK